MRASWVDASLAACLAVITGVAAWADVSQAHLNGRTGGVVAGVCLEADSMDEIPGHGVLGAWSAGCEVMLTGSPYQGEVIRRGEGETVRAYTILR